MPKKIKQAATKENAFESSPRLKAFFNEQLEVWKKKHRLPLEVLAERCGVTNSYLSQIGRYGRIPGRPVLILLAFNFELGSPEDLLRVAGFHSPWPYDAGIGFGAKQRDENGFLSVRLDMDGFTAAIKHIVQSETKSRSITSLIGSRVLRIGVDTNHEWLFDSSSSKGAAGKKRWQMIAPFEDFFEMLALSLQCKVETIPIPYLKYRAAFENNELDLFGPIATGPHRLVGHSSVPFCHIGHSALVRTKPSTYLDVLPVPRSTADLISKPYEIAVVRDAPAHLFANTRLRRSDDQLVICDTLEEAMERVTMDTISKAVHVTLCNSLNAMDHKAKFSKAVALAFVSKESVLEEQHTGLIIRPDWPELVRPVNDALQYLIRTGSLEERFKPVFDKYGTDIFRIAEV